MWSPQQYLDEGRIRGVPRKVLDAAVEQLDHFHAQQLEIPAILTLGHLAHHVGVSYWRLREAVERAPDTYRHFVIRKRSGGRRTISVPNRDLMATQRWLAVHVLNSQAVHPSSYAFRPGLSIMDCAARHTGARWLVKLDIAGFFDSISEIRVFRVFRSLGYQRLVAFELARLTTCIWENSTRYMYPAWQNYNQNVTIDEYLHEYIGHLPQVAPTSPMLSNLVMRELDEEIEKVARQANLVYTRYSDDMTFSTRGKYSRSEAARFTQVVSKLLRPNGLHLNRRKTTIVPPGARKVVLGLTVDGSTPRLSRSYRSRLRQHMYFLEKFGPIEHMRRRGFETVLGMKYHIRGHIDFAYMVDKAYGSGLLKRFMAIDWPV